MSSAHPDDARRLRRARTGTLLAFSTNGALIGSLLPRYPEVADALGLSTGQLGFVVMLFGLGAGCAGSMPGWWLRRLGTQRVSTASTWLIALALIGAGLATEAGPSGVWVFGPLLFLAGIGDAIADVSQNSQGLRVQAAYGRSVLNSMHAGWSAGAALGGVASALAARLDLPLALHLAISGTICAVIVSAAATVFLPDPPPVADHEATAVPPAPRASTLRALVLTAPLVFIALGGFAVEEIGNNWSAYFLREQIGLTAAVAGLGVPTVLGAQFVGRLVGDRFIDALGSRSAVRVSLVAVAAGMALAAWAPSAAFAFIGFAVAGLGSAVTVPVLYHAADNVPGLAAHQGLATVSALMRFSTLVISPAVGLIGQSADLRISLTVVAIAGLGGLALTRRLP